jgi:hypothetical protein
VVVGNKRLITRSAARSGTTVLVRNIWIVTEPMRMRMRMRMSSPTERDAVNGIGIRTHAGMQMMGRVWGCQRRALTGPFILHKYATF